jgi:hypothetical protein
MQPIEERMIERGKDDVFVFTMTLVGNLISFICMVFVFNRIRLWRGDKGVFKNKQMDIDEDYVDL